MKFPAPSNNYEGLLKQFKAARLTIDRQGKTISYLQASIKKLKDEDKLNSKEEVEALRKTNEELTKELIRLEDYLDDLSRNNLILK